LQEDLAKDIFIFLPSRIKTTSNDFTQPKPVEQKNTINVNSISKIEKVKEPPLKLAQQNIIQAEEITTMWSIASKIKKETNNTSIYQIMWSIYLGNKDAFIDGNINLVRKDKNLVVPSYATMGNVSSVEAKSSILAMNKSYSIDIAPAVKSLLVLTAPSIEKKQKPPELGIVEDKEEPSSININNENASNPEDFIKENTKQLEVVIENKIAKDLSNEINSIDESVAENNFGLMDLLFVAITSVLSGILIALIYIQLKSRKTKNIQYDFEEAQDSKSSIQGLPKGLSIKNNHEEQQLDLAVTYFEMGNTEDCLSILNDLIKQSQDEEIKTSAQNLIEKIVKK
jgi:FimV-like protein